MSNITLFTTLLFYAVFIGQIYFLSYYFPRKVRDRMKQVMECYPPRDYPKLYPKPLEYYAKFHRNYELMNQVLLLGGIILMFVMAYWGTLSGREISEVIPWAYFMLQMGPLMWVEFSEFSCFKKMRQADLRTKKTANLQPRRLFDVISPLLFSVVVLFFLTGVFFSLYINNFDYQWGGKAFLNIAIITSGNLFFAGIIYWNLYGKKLDPYQTSEDRIRLIKITVKSLAFVSIGVSIFMMASQAINVFELDILEPVSMSIYLQLLAFASIGARLQALPVEDFNFDVYKADAPVA